MTFSEALNIVLSTAATKVKRKNWDRAFIARQYDQKERKTYVMMFFKHSYLKSYSASRYMPFPDDLIANDWEVIKDDEV